MERLAHHGNGIALLYNRCDSKLFQDTIFVYASGIRFLRGRIKFFKPNGIRGGSPGCGSVLVSFGEENARILDNCAIPGKFFSI